MASLGHADTPPSGQRISRETFSPRKTSLRQPSTFKPSRRSISAAELALLIASISGRTALIASLAVFASAATGNDPSLLLLSSSSRQSLRSTCEDYKYNMTKHNRSNPLLSSKQAVSSGEPYHEWLHKGWHLNRQFLAQANIAWLSDNDRDSDRAQSAILNGAAKCYTAGVSFGGYDNN